MTRIDFYILPDVDLEARWRFAARLTHRVWNQGHQLLWLAPNPDTAQSLDDFLWQYPHNAFIPHGCVGSDAAAGAPVVIGAEDVPDHDDVLINLGDTLPAFFARFERVAEIVIQDPAVRDPSRERFKHYRERGYPLFHHDMSDWQD